MLTDFRVLNLYAWGWQVERGTYAQGKAHQISKCIHDIVITSLNFRENLILIWMCRHLFHTWVFLNELDTSEKDFLKFP